MFWFTGYYSFFYILGSSVNASLNEKTVFWESEPFSNVDSVIKFPDDFKSCKIICISLSKYGRVSTPYIIYKNYGNETEKIKFEVSDVSGWYAIPKETGITYKGFYGNSGINIPYVVAFGIK